MIDLKHAMNELATGQVECSAAQAELLSRMQSELERMEEISAMLSGLARRRSAIREALRRHWPHLARETDRAD